MVQLTGEVKVSFGDSDPDEMDPVQLRVRESQQHLSTVARGVFALQCFVVARMVARNVQTVAREWSEQEKNGSARPSGY
jgi:hypothetical protein